MTVLDQQNYYDQIYRAAKADNREKFRDLFLKLHEYDQVHVFHELYPDNKVKITHFLTAEEFAQLFDQMEQEERLEALEALPDHYMTEVFAHVADDNVVALLSRVDEAQQQHLLEIMHPRDRRPIEKMLQHDAYTAGAIMTTELVAVSMDDTVDQVLETMRQIGQQAETMYYIYVVDQGQHLEGVLSLRQLILASKDTLVRDIMTTQIIAATVEMDQEEVAQLIQEYNLVALPVMTVDRILVGIVTVDDVIDIIEDEATEDFHRFAGITPSTDEVEAEDESIWVMTKARLPWILILLFLGLFSANLISRFEDTLSQVVALAAFMPILTDSAGNVGTQALAVSVRRLTMGGEQPSFWKMIWKELCAGILIGLASAITITIIAYIMYGNLPLALIIGTAILVTLSVSTVVGYSVPALFSRLGIDPAVASGPFITTMNDIFGLFIYFSMATALLHLIQ